MSASPTFPGAVALVASSFGAQLALALIARVPAKIDYLSIVGGILDLRTALVRLGLTDPQAMSAALGLTWSLFCGSMTT
jgi:alpha-beta hydrolase superfamily lysophospholipase